MTSHECGREAESHIDDGGPAYPTSISADGPFGGMTLRDYFAGQVLAGTNAYSFKWSKDAANFAYDVADDMLARRNKGRAP